MLLYNAVRQTQNAFLIPFIFGLLLVTIHLARKDKRFLVIAFKNSVVKSWLP